MGYILKNIGVCIGLLLSFRGFAQLSTIEISTNPITYIVMLDETSYFLANISTEVQVAKDLGIEVDYLRSIIVYYPDSEFHRIRGDQLWNKFIFQSNFYFRPNLGMDRWFISGLLAVETSNGPYDFSTYTFNASTGRSIKHEHIIQGNVQQYYLMAGFGYKRVFWDRIPVRLSFGIGKIFAFHYSDTILAALKDLKDKSRFATGIKGEITVGYRFHIKTAKKIAK